MKNSLSMWLVSSTSHTSHTTYIKPHKLKTLAFLIEPNDNEVRARAHFFEVNFNVDKKKGQILQWSVFGPCSPN